MTVNNRGEWLKLALIYWSLSALIISYGFVAYSQEADGTNCPSGVVGLCTPGTFESAIETVTET